MQSQNQPQISHQQEFGNNMGTSLNDAFHEGVSNSVSDPYQGLSTSERLQRLNSERENIDGVAKSSQREQPAFDPTQSVSSYNRQFINNPSAFFQKKK